MKQSASRTSQQRASLNQQALEDYLKTIYVLEQEHSPVTTSAIAEARKVMPASVTSMIKRLDSLGMVDYRKHRGVLLTDKGKSIALEVIRHHRLLELYLAEALGFGWDEVHEEADRLEHVVSGKMAERIAEALGNPEFDPHGDPIPTRHGKMAESPARPLAAVEIGESCRVTRVPSDYDQELLRHIGSLGLTPGAEVTVVDKALFDDPITLLVDGVKQRIGATVAAAVLVTERAS